MGEEIAISLKNVSKCYKRYARPVERLKEIMLPGKSYAQEFWALRDVSFDVMKGETMGIIGRNGAGKSTLLQMICGTLTPTSGEAQVNGRVAALLELGAGFNPEFTGRENVYMNGAIMGLSRQEVEARFEQVAAFADIGDFIDQPVKTYSSGMYVRLAFASAIHVEPDILIVDEALSVGDMAFQHKCMTKMKQLMAKGTTVLFVSHDTGSVKSLCHRCAYLEHGSLKAVSKASDVTNQYLKDIRSEINNTTSQQLLIGSSALDTENSVINSSTSEAKSISFDTAFEDKISNSNKITKLNFPTEFKIDPALDAKTKGFRYGTMGAKICCIEMLNKEGEPSISFDFNEIITLRTHIYFFKEVDALNCCFIVRNNLGIDIIGTTTFDENYKFPLQKEGGKLVVDFKFHNILNPRQNYSIQYSINNTYSYDHQEILDAVDNAYVFQSNRQINRPIWYTVWQPIQIYYNKCGLNVGLE